VESILFFLARITYYALTIYEWVIIIAIVVSWVNPDPNNQIVSFMNRVTLPLWNWLARRLPRSLSMFSAYFSLLLVWFLKIFAPGTLITLGKFLGSTVSISDVPSRIFGFFLLGVGVVLQNFIFFLMLLLLIWFFLTLVNPSVNNPIVRTLVILVDPFITPLQKRLPRMKVDLSPLIMAGVLFILNTWVVAELIMFAVGLTNGGIERMLHGPA